MGARRRNPRLLPPAVSAVEVRNLPWTYTTEDLLSEWQCDEALEYLILPYSVRRGRIVGYALVKFISHEHAQAFADQWHGFFLSTTPATGQPLDVKASEGTQWRQILARLKGEEADHLWRVGFLPAIFDRGVRWDTERVMNEIAISAAMEDLFQDIHLLDRAIVPAAASVPWPALTSVADPQI